MIELKQGETYIIQKRCYNEVHKIRVIELTKTSIYIEYLDRQTKVRYGLEQFNATWKPIEVLLNTLINNLMKDHNLNKS